MRLAVAGKGGAGKTSIAGTLARQLARRGHTVVAIDDDPNPTLAFTLGLPPDAAVRVPALPTEVMGKVDSGWQLTATPPELVSRYGVAAPDGVQLLVSAQPERAGEG